MSPTSFRTALPRDIRAGPKSDEWGKVDSNHRRHCQQIYSLSPLATREFPHICKKAGDRTRTDNLLITNQLLCQLSHTGNPIDLFQTSVDVRLFCIYGTYRARTYDPLLVRQVLSQLSYDPISADVTTAHLQKTTQIGFEPTTSAVTGRRSNQLSHWA